jgi:hypothetical protein
VPSFPPGSSNFESMQSLVIVLMIVCITAIVISQYASWAKNQSSPVQKRRARIVAKRSHVWGGGDDFPTSTTYYVTFEFADDGSRCELVVPDKEFGLMAEGDEGTLNYQGTQFNSFRRGSDMEDTGRRLSQAEQLTGPNVRYTRRPETQLRRSPSLDGEVVARLPKHTAVEVVKVEGNHSLVRYRANLTEQMGYIANGFLGTEDEQR